MFYDHESKEVFTLDVDSLLRQWSLQTGQCIKSFPLEILQQNQTCNDETEIAYNHKAKIQACAMLTNKEYPKKCIAVAFE